MTAGAAAGAAAAAMIQAAKASGVVVRVQPGEFQTILERVAAPLVVRATRGVFSTKYRYLVGYKGLVFFTESREPLTLAPEMEIVNATKIWVPD